MAILGRGVRAMESVGSDAREGPPPISQQAVDVGPAKELVSDAEVCAPSGWMRWNTRRSGEVECEECEKV
jgi:hypothetical protein